MATSNLEKAFLTLGKLTADELQQLRGVIDALLDTGQGLEEQPPRAKGYREVKRITKTLADGTQKDYFYLYLRVWKDGKLTSRYLGKAGEPTG